MNSSDAMAFAASRAIENGEWDRHLQSLSIAIRHRLFAIERILAEAGKNGK